LVKEFKEDDYENIYNCMPELNSFSKFMFFKISRYAFFPSYSDYFEWIKNFDLNNKITIEKYHGYPFAIIKHNK